MLKSWILGEENGKEKFKQIIYRNDSGRSFGDFLSKGVAPSCALVSACAVIIASCSISGQEIPKTPARIIPVNDLFKFLFPIFFP